MSNSYNMAARQSLYKINKYKRKKRFINGMTCSRNKLNTLHVFKRILVTKVDIFKSCLVQNSMETLFISRNVLLSCEPVRYYFH